MEQQAIFQENHLDLQFGYESYYGSVPKQGWLLSYNIEKNEATNLRVALYFVDEFSCNFKAVMPFYPSLLVECKEDFSSVEDFIKRKFEGYVYDTTLVERVDVNEPNHLNKPHKQFLKICFTSESAIQQAIRYLRESIAERSETRYKDEIYKDFLNEIEDVSAEIVGIHEYDIPFEIQVGTHFSIRCGCWYDVFYDGENYNIVSNSSKITYPDLKLFAFDIETTKPPLKFPNSEVDQIMMISIMTEDFGELIVNRNIVSKEIQDFEYNAKDEMKCVFRVSNEPNEEALLVRFLEVVLEHAPHIITTYNGSFFDWPFISKRLQKYKMNLCDAIQFKELYEYYECPFIIHLDCYRWVKRDSYLPMNNQGLKDVTRIKLGYFPDEVDPEDMVRLATEDPQKLASYSVSDAVATYFLYLKYVHSHIFSVCSLIPLPPVQILCRGAGTLCESLLVAESGNYKILIPPKKKTSNLEFYRGHLVENLTYVGGHVESLKAGIFRADFDQDFIVDEHMINLIVENIDSVLADYHSTPDYKERRDEYVQRLVDSIGKYKCKGRIYHLDVGAMYPNIILTNRLQPISVVNDEICVRCDYNDGNNQCKKAMQWISKVDFIPPAENEVNMIRNQLANEAFTLWNDDKTEKIPYERLPIQQQNAILKERVQEYSRNIYKKTKKTTETLEDIYICQREVPFYVETVRKFRDQRYVYKSLYKKAALNYEKDPTNENKKSLIVYNSLQVAYKCILNSFYGYVMREGSRWFSLEMAATVCHVGGQIIKLARELVEKIGIPLELDTDGIWGILPERFPFDVTFGNKTISGLNLILNYFVCGKFTNYQYQMINKEGQFEIVPQNTIFFEIDGPYKTMVIPSSTEENKLLKKRYVVFDDQNKVVELKGFELKRRGELNIVKKFQEDIFTHFNDGETLQDCYKSLAKVCNYWLDIIYQQGGPLDDDAVFHLFSESRNMSKSICEYGGKKSNILSTAKRLSEFLGDDILEEKLKCEFIISKYPANAPIAERAIPVMIFKSVQKNEFLNKWLKTSKATDLKDIIDWEYYKKRFENILQRLIVIPAYLQKIENPVPRVCLPSWVKDMTKKERLEFSKIKSDDIEDLSLKRSLGDMFFTGHANKKPKIEDNTNRHKSLESNDCVAAIDNEIRNTKSMDFALFVKSKKESWMLFFKRRSSLESTVLCLEFNGNEDFTIRYANGTQKKFPITTEVLMDVSNREHFKESDVVDRYIPDQNLTKSLVRLSINASDIHSEKYLEFFNHFSIGPTYQAPTALYEVFGNNRFECEYIDVIAVSSFNYLKKVVFAVTISNKTVFASEIRHPSITRTSLEMVKSLDRKAEMVVVHCKSDPNMHQILSSFSGMCFLPIEVQPRGFLENFENLMKTHVDINADLLNNMSLLLDVSKISGIPLINIDDRVLDYMLYREYLGNGIATSQQSRFSPRIIRDETAKSGFYNTFCVQMECANSLILSIIEYKSVTGNTPLYHGHERKDFQVLRNFLRGLVLCALKGNRGLSNLLSKVGYWIKNGSKIIDPDLREIIETTEQRYVIGMISHLKKHKYKVLAVSKNIFFIDTEKTTHNGAEMFIEHLKKKISAFPGYELVNLRSLRMFEKLSFVDHGNYFFLEGSTHDATASKDSLISGFSDYSIPVEFLKIYFSDVEIKNEDVYSLVKKLDIGTLRILLKILSYKRDVHGLASNCYKLLGKNEFDTPSNTDFNLCIFCKKCGFENFLRKNCIKCYSNVDRESLELVALEYMKYCWKMQIFGDRYCNRCGECGERRLREYCCCGGKLVHKDYIDEVKNVQRFVSTRRFDDEVDKFIRYFKNK